MNTAQITLNRGRVLVVLVAAVLLVGLATHITATTDLGNWQPAFELVCLSAMALFPFLLARLMPAAAGFDAQWLPSSRRHWIWFLAMFALLFAVKVLMAALYVIIIGPVPADPPGTLSAPIAFIFQAIVVILVGPVAEEIFFRGYLLEQLRKLVRSSTALLVQSFLFALGHIYAWGFSFFSLSNCLDALLFGVILGLWRIRFRSLLPLILVHILSNAPSISLFVERYNQAVEYNQVVSQTNTTEAPQSDETRLDELMKSAETCFNKGEYASALRQYRKAIEVAPRYSPAHYDLGWIYATCPDPARRDGEKALFYATKTVSLWFEDSAVSDDRRAEWMPWSCLAAAHAERGEFAKAIENQKKAIECVCFVPEHVRPWVEARLKACLALYAARKPLRSKQLSLGRLSEAWLNGMLHPGPEGFPEIAE